MKPHQFEIFKKTLDKIEVTNIGEIGTHRGRSAKQFCLYALESHNKPVHYTGYDVFDLMTKEQSHSLEFNGKSIGDETEATQRLNNLKKLYPNRLTFKLNKGFTRDTLTTPITFDFVYIDGGHSYETVMHDWHMVKESKIVFFDDWHKADVAKALKEVEKTHSVDYYTMEQQGRWTAIVRNI